MQEHDNSQRRACRLVGVDPKTVERDRPPENPKVREEMNAIASKRRRFGYRRIGVLLERKGMIMNHENCTASSPRKSWASGGEEVASMRVDHEHLCRRLCDLVSVGR